MCRSRLSPAGRLSERTAGTSKSLPPPRYDGFNVRDQTAQRCRSGCELIFRDNASGGRWDRPELHKLLSQLRKGDVLVVWTLDRLSRSLRVAEREELTVYDQLVIPVSMTSIAL